MFNHALQLPNLVDFSRPDIDNLPKSFSINGTLDHIADSQIVNLCKTINGYSSTKNSFLARIPLKTLYEFVCFRKLNNFLAQTIFVTIYNLSSQNYVFSDNLLHYINGKVLERNNSQIQIPEFYFNDLFLTCIKSFDSHMLQTHLKLILELAGKKIACTHRSEFFSNCYDDLIDALLLNGEAFSENSQDLIVNYYLPKISNNSLCNADIAFIKKLNAQNKDKLLSAAMNDTYTPHYSYFILLSAMQNDLIQTVLPKLLPKIFRAFHSLDFKEPSCLKNIFSDTYAYYISQNTINLRILQTIKSRLNTEEQLRINNLSEDHINKLLIHFDDKELNLEQMRSCINESLISIFSSLSEKNRLKIIMFYHTQTNGAGCLGLIHLLPYTNVEERKSILPAILSLFPLKELIHLQNNNNLFQEFINSLECTKLYIADIETLLKYLNSFDKTTTDLKAQKKFIELQALLMYAILNKSNTETKMKISNSALQHYEYLLEKHPRLITTFNKAILLADILQEFLLVVSLNHKIRWLEVLQKLDVNYFKLYPKLISLRAHTINHLPLDYIHQSINEICELPNEVHNIIDGYVAS